MANGEYTFAGLTFRIGDEVNTPDGWGWITGFDTQKGYIAVHLGTGPVKWYWHKDVSGD